ncbi:unnamed protein product [Oppiella nova]|uniref:RING-type domain-containing protein n=1 Tax=Oppiella nova TaxID=334625 RepID=A0A7R9LX10_9ACAR|nr:unnamed protein product [Oppiella nova]CAG2167110.1 unnamed protein product [Oppiella nova]
MSGLDKNRVIGVTDEELDEYTCGICLEVFVDPVVTQCCQQTYCSECMYGWLSDHNTCPNDRKELSREGLGRAPRFVVNLLNNMKVKCDFYANGCKSVVKMSELSQHIDYCDYNESRKCATCHLPIDGNTQHNCIENLLIHNKSLCDEIKRIQSDNHKLSMCGVIELARKDLDNCSVKSRKNISSIEMELCIKSTKEVISRCNSFMDISTHIHNVLNDNTDDTANRLWHCIAFSKHGGESLVTSKQYCHLVCGLLHIEAYYALHNAISTDV